MGYRIITDSGCDLPAKLLAQLNIDVIPLTLLFRGQEWSDTTDEGLKTIYDGLRSGDAASTSAINPDRWSVAMEPVLEQGQDILVLTFSSGLSTTYQSAVIAAQELMEKYPGRKIRVVDSLCASLGQGLFVWYACKNRDAGMSLDALADWCEENKLNLCHWVTVDDLSHLKRGGRISATTALVGTMLNVKPIIHVDEEGHLINSSKVRGRKAAMEYLAKKFDETCINFDEVFIAHGDCPEDAANLEAMIRAKHEIKNVTTGYVGPVIGAHTGPGVLVLFFLGSKR